MTSIRDKVSNALRLSPKPLSRPTFRSYVTDEQESGNLTTSADQLDQMPANNPAAASDPGPDETSDEADVDVEMYTSTMSGKTYSYETNLSELNPFSKFRRESYYLSIQDNDSASEGVTATAAQSSDWENRMTDQSSGISIDYRIHEHVLCKLGSVFRYSLNCKRTKGSIGVLVLTNVRLKFVNYNESVGTSDSILCPPFDIHSFLDESVVGSGAEYDDDIDFLSVHRFEQSTKDKNSSSHFLLTLICYDYRRIEFLLVDCSDSRSFVEMLSKLLSPPPTSSSGISVPNLSSAPSSASLTIAGRRIHELPMIWYIVSTQYQFFERKQWEEREGYWCLNNPFLRLTQCNESLQVSTSLPKCFVASVLLSDIVLMENIANQLNGRRVPLISFSVPVNKGRNENRHSRLVGGDSIKIQSSIKSGTGVVRVDSRNSSTVKPALAKKPPIVLTRMKDHRLLLRSVTLTQDVNNLIRSSISPLRLFDLNSLLKSVSSVEVAHNKLLQAVVSKNTNRYLSLLAKWMKLVTRVLRIVQQVVHVLSNEASVILTEEHDRFWNPIISSLVQVVLDPNRRTIQGFECLLSREWMFVNGHANRYPDSMRSPNHISFVLFLDCVHQLMAFSNNGTLFQYNSVYLVRLLDLQYLPSPFSSENNVRDLLTSFEDLTRIGCPDDGRRKSAASFTTSGISSSGLLDDHPNRESGEEVPMTLESLTADQVLLLLNPFYEPQDRVLQVPQLTAQLSFFEGLYLRWNWQGKDRKLEYFMRFPLMQEIGLDYVLRQKLGLEWPHRRKRPSIDEDVEPVVNTTDNYTETEL